MFLKYTLIAICMFGFLFGKSQEGRTTTSAAYTLMLKALLKNSVNAISAKTAYTWYSNAQSETVFLDARPQHEYAVSHIQGAIPVGYEEFSLLVVDRIPKNAKIVVYCSVGYRSEKIGEKLAAAGFTQVYNLFGGVFEWVNSGYGVVNSKGKTQQVHAYNSKWGIWLKKGEKVY